MQKKNEAGWARLWTFGLSVAAILCAYLVMRVNPMEIALAYLALLAAAIAMGLITNLWGGLVASALSVFTMIMLNQYAGVYPRESMLVNISSELAAFLVVGPLAGLLSETLWRMQRQTQHWLMRSEELTVHDETFGTLKPQWARTRLEEEVARAVQFGRPLALLLLQLEPVPGSLQGDVQAQRRQRIAALQALVRMGRSRTQPPSVVSHLGSNQVLVMLPEHSSQQAQQLAGVLRRQMQDEMYFPQGDGARLGSPLSEWGSLLVGVAALHPAAPLDGEAQAMPSNAVLPNAEMLLEQAWAALEHPNGQKASVD